MKETIEYGRLPVVAGLVVYAVLSLAEQFLGTVIGQAAAVAALAAILAGFIVNAHDSAVYRQAEEEHWKKVEDLLEAIAKPITGGSETRS